MAIERLENVKAMDKVIKNHFQDENVIDSWLMSGVPDAATDEDYAWFADNELEYDDLVDLFIRLVNRELTNG